jgi:hypothetical protein
VSSGSAASGAVLAQETQPSRAGWLESGSSSTGRHLAAIEHQLQLEIEALIAEEFGDGAKRGIGAALGQKVVVALHAQGADADADAALAIPYSVADNCTQTNLSRGRFFVLHPALGGAIEAIPGAGEL